MPCPQSRLIGSFGDTGAWCWPKRAHSVVGPVDGVAKKIIGLELFAELPIEEWAEMQTQYSAQHPFTTGQDSARSL